jgi:hypothetical protein
MPKTRSDRHLNGIVTTALGGGAEGDESRVVSKTPAHDQQTEASEPPPLPSQVTLTLSTAGRDDGSKFLVQFSNLHGLSDVVGTILHGAGYPTFEISAVRMRGRARMVENLDPGTFVLAWSAGHQNSCGGGQRGL